MLSCYIILQSIIKRFQMVTAILDRNEVKYGSGGQSENGDKQSCHSCMSHFILTYFIFL